MDTTLKLTENFFVEKDEHDLETCKAKPPYNAENVSCSHGYSICYEDSWQSGVYEAPPIILW